MGARVPRPRPLLPITVECPPTLSHAGRAVACGPARDQKTAERKSESGRGELLPGAAHSGPQRIPVPLSVNSTGPEPGPELGVPGGPSNPAKQAPTRTAQRAQSLTRSRAARTSQAVCPGPVVSRGGGVAEASPRAQRAQAAASSAAAVQLRHSDPDGDFHLLRGARGTAQRKWLEGQRPASPSPFSLSHCQGVGKWLSVSPKAWITLIRRVRRPNLAAHTRGRGRARSHSNQREGGRAPRASGARPPRNSSSCPSSPPPLLMDEPRELAPVCASLRVGGESWSWKERKEVRGAARDGVTAGHPYPGRSGVPEMWRALRGLAAFPWILQTTKA